MMVVEVLLRIEFFLLLVVVSFFFCCMGRVFGFWDLCGL